MSQPAFEMVKYHAKEYPQVIPLDCEEVAGHFDINEIKSGLKNYSLHTEYSYGKRKFENDNVKKFEEICASNKNGVPQLWKTKKWAEEFAEFIFAITEGLNPPEVIEIHPPFDDYTDAEKFIENYMVFEKIILNKYPETKIMIENRCGSIYKNGKFLLSKMDDFKTISKLIEKNNLNLLFAFDIPQLYTAHNCKTGSDYMNLLEEAKDIRKYIGGVHLWGKRKSDSGRKVSHCGDLNSYFDNNDILVNEFMGKFAELFDDGTVRKMVLEVNSSNEDLLSIINELLKQGVIFT